MNSIIERIMSNAKESELEVAFSITGVVAIATVCYRFFRSVDSPGLAPAMEEEETRKIMREILGKLQLSAPEMVTRIQDIQKDFEQHMGQGIDENTRIRIMKQFAVPEFERTLKEIQNKVVDDSDYYLSELEEASNTYVKEGDEELIEIYKKIRALYRHFGGDGGDEDEGAGADEGATVDMSADEVVQLMVELTKQVLQATDLYCAKFIDKIGVPKTQAHLEDFQMGQMKLMEK
jgi:hypothetical protein